MLSWCPVQRSKASTRVRDRVIMLSWCPVHHDNIIRVIMLSYNTVLVCKIGLL